MTSSGSPYARFRRALTTGNLAMVRTAAAELPQVDLDDALEVCALMAGTEPQRYDRAPCGGSRGSAWSVAVSR